MSRDYVRDALRAAASAAPALLAALSCCTLLAPRASAQLTGYSDRAAWLAAAGAPTASEDFEEFGADTPFGWVVVPLSTGWITATGSNAWVSRIDVPPFASTWHGGTSYAKCWTHAEDSDEVEIHFARPVSAFGSAFYDAIDQGYLNVDFYVGHAWWSGTHLGRVSPAVNGAAFLGVTSATAFDMVRLTTESLTLWEEFGLDQIEIVETCGEAVAYCTAGTTSSGCAPSISASGTPSVSAGSGFTISATAVEGARSGMVFYGVSGPLAQPWSPASTSYLCVAGPRQRTPVADSVGNVGTCDGSLALDWNLYAATTPGALGTPFGGGEAVYAQAYFRDPPAPRGTNLSDALRFVVCP